MSYDRVLPKPAALHYDSPQVTLPRPTSNLLEHKIMNDNISRMSLVDSHIDGLPMGASCRYAADGIPQVHISSLNRALSSISSNAPVEPSKPPATLTANTKTIPLRDRPSTSERSSSSSPIKSTTPRESVTQFCLCQPDPKIPRPRNAFILYRQHYQAAVVAQNPGLANPDISKIIGEQWRKLPQETKDEWKALAEEEKARHQQQYPEYRYQPRRYGRDGTTRGSSSGISHNPPGSSVCSRCGGRVMNPPVSPDTPFTPNSSSHSSRAPSLQETVTIRSYHCRAKDSDRPPAPIRVGSNGEPLPSRQRQWESNGSRSPDSKRRRFNSQVGFKPNIHRDKTPDSAYPASTYAPRPSVDAAHRGNVFQVLQPPRSFRNSRDYHQPDPSLKLPPLQTGTPSSNTMTPMTPYSHDGSSLEATVMTIPFLNKIKVLAKISPPLVPSFRDGGLQRRGVVISVDGQEPASVKSVVDHLNNMLQKEGKYQPRIFEGPEIRTRDGYSESGQMGDATVDYLNTISVWHRISDEVVGFVKSPFESADAKVTDDNASTPGVSPKTVVSKPATNHQISSPPSSETGSVSAASFPVALVPRYQLTTADAFACSVPIDDSYAPLDHWQWMASLWRACVGPDITVYVRECEQEELDRYGGNPVEVRLQDARTVVVRKAANSPNELEEKVLKRVGFEIEDFLTQNDGQTSVHSGSSTTAPTLPSAHKSIPNPLLESSNPRAFGYIENCDIYIPVGALKKYNRPSPNPTEAQEDDYPAAEVANLEKHHWIWTSTYPHHRDPNYSFVRVYVLPDDVGRRFIPRSGAELRRALKTVMAKIDPAPSAWCGVFSSQQNIMDDAVEDESLWYIFNTLQDPEPCVDKMRVPHAKRAMQDLLSSGSNERCGEISQENPSVLGLKTLLYPYQARSAAMMIQREAQPAQMLDPRLQKQATPTGREYFYNKEEGNIVCEKKLYSEACGGILAETMGCGKTLICLAVILATRGHFPQIPLQYQEMKNPIRDKTASLVTMAATTAGRLSLPWKSYFQALKFEGAAHDKCIEACEENRGSYIIPPPPARHSGRSGVAYPRPPPQKLLLGHGTLIIVPPNLVNHWEHEITNHTEGLKVLIMRASSDVTPPPEDLLQYDIILFSRVRFEREAGEVVNNRRNSTKPEESHLTKIHWLRIIVDEGHNVAGSGHRTNMVHILDQLYVERRWIVSGTPSSGLYGVEVSLASQETHTSDTDLTEATTAVLSGKRKTGNAIDSELKDVDKLRLIVVDFLDLKPWSNSRADDPANWTKYMKPIGEDGKRRKARSLRVTLQSLVVRHRMETIHNEIPLPRLHNKVVHLEPTFYDKLNLNMFIFILAVNAITSERIDQDYMFHPRNRKHLSVLISNLRQAGFWWAGSEGDISGTIDIAVRYLENNRSKMAEDDIVMLTEGIRVARMAVDCEGWNAFKDLHELGVFVDNFPSHARALWALNSSSPAEPILLGISQAHHAQKFVTRHLNASDPAEGLAGAGIKVRRELAERDSHSDPAKKSTPDKPMTTKSPKKSFSKGLFKTLPRESPLTQTKLIATASAKLTYLLDQVLELHEQEKIIIFYDNNNSAYWIAEGLELLGIDFRIYANTLKPTLRAAYLALFRESDEVRVLLMDLRQASHGLHIANASRVFIVNPIWQPNVESQAIKRAHRIGQTKPVFVETLVLKDTLEDKILQRRKAMSDTEIQHAEKDLLDDSTMSSIIQSEHFLPLPENEFSAKLAYLKTPPGIFDRHKLSLPDDFYDKATDSPASPSPLKRKRVEATLDSSEASTTDEQDSLHRERRIGLDSSIHLSPNGIFMPSTSASSTNPVATRLNGDDAAVKKPKKTVSIFGYGKTTLARLLLGVFSNLESLHINTFIIHEDDFYFPDDKIPYTTTPSGKTVQDWDTISAIDVGFLSSALGYVRTHGSLPPRIKSIQDFNEVTDSGVDETTLIQLRRLVRDRLGATEESLPTIAFLEGFLLFSPPEAEDASHVLRSVHDKIDVHLFLPAAYDAVKERREGRSGYVTSGPAPEGPSELSSQGGGDGCKDAQEVIDLDGEDDRPPQNFWVDPPGYVDDIVWPRYVHDHAWLLLPECEDARDWVSRVGQGVNVRSDAGVMVAPGQGTKPMVEILRWAVEEVMKLLEKN
ncbi:hypothetical protein FE257_009235 [Aspergillus nanangensis]|uniref:SNF2 family helicase n=1 Tax=Aspergillus nanangensis TaxID=2582783 RepID=A0AAD4CKA4_ASPNN|nr:hypothetical protein FE257_009235 [Aspergillus nanangensis]